MTATAFQDIDIAALTESKWNPRKHYDQGKLEELAASIREKGVIEPIVVRANGKPGTFEILAGSRRFRASKLAGLTSLPAVVRVIDDTAALELAVIENGQREDVHPLDEAEGYRALMKADKHYTVAVVAAKVGKSESYVYRRMKLLDLVKDARRAFEADRLTVAHAERLARLSPELQQNAYDHELYHPFYMFADGEDEKPKDQRLPNRDALRPLAELDSFITRHSAVDPSAPETQHYFPEIAEAADEALEAEDEDGDPAPATLLQLSTHHFVRQELGLTANSPCPLASPRWHAITGPKDRCEHITRGAIVHGAHDQVGRILDVCATKGCARHFPAKKKTRATTTAAKPAGKSQWEIEQERRVADQKEWDAFWPTVASAVAAQTSKAKFSAALVRSVLHDGYIELMNVKAIEKHFRVTLTDQTAAQVLLLSVIEFDSRRAFLDSAKRIGFNLGATEQKYKAAQKAEAKPAAPAKAKGAKKR